MVTCRKCNQPLPPGAMMTGAVRVRVAALALSVDGQDVVFVNVVSASGAKYVSGVHEWWNKGADASLHNVTEGPDAAPVLTCTENVQTP